MNYLYQIHELSGCLSKKNLSQVDDESLSFIKKKLNTHYHHPHLLHLLKTRLLTLPGKKNHIVEITQKFKAQPIE